MSRQRLAAVADQDHTGELSAGAGAGAGRCHNLRLILESYLSSALPTTSQPVLSLGRPRQKSGDTEAGDHGLPMAHLTIPVDTRHRHPITECLQQLFPRVDNDV